MSKLEQTTIFIIVAGVSCLATMTILRALIG
jgi:hypothetical protein